MSLTTHHPSPITLRPPAHDRPAGTHGALHLGPAAATSAAQDTPRAPRATRPRALPSERPERARHARLAWQSLPPRRHLGRRGGELRDLLRARDRRRALSVRRARVTEREPAHPPARAQRSGV